MCEEKQYRCGLFENTVGNQLHEYFCFVVDREQGFLRIDRFLMNKFGNTISRSRIQRAAKTGCIFVNNCSVKSSYKVKPKDVISAKIDYRQKKMVVIPENIPFSVIHEDEDLIVINKPAGLVVHPGNGHYNGTLVNAIAWYYLFKCSSDLPINYEDFRFGLVHRIDKDTSGLLIFAKNSETKDHLGKQFLYKTIKRTYWTLVWGNVKEDEGMIEGNIGRDLHNRLLMSVFPKGKNGKYAVTYYKVLERFLYVTLLECKLVTGRTHQIRTHMKYIGHPVFNDMHYGGNEILRGNTHTKYKWFVQNCFKLCPRQALHAKTLGFIHPKTGRDIYLETPLPEDMVQLIDKWRSFSTSN